MKVVPGKRYTRQQLAEAIDQSTADELKLQGYVLQYDALTQTYGVVPWYEAGGGEKFGTLRAPRGGAGTFEPVDPIRKRTPSERVDSLMLKLIDDMKKAGGIPVLQTGIDSRGTKEQDEAGRRRHREIEENERRIKEIVGEAWKAGRTEITADVVRIVAARLLGYGEKEKQLADFKKVSDYNPSN